MNKQIAIICEYTIFPERLGGMDRFFVAYDEALKKEGFVVQWFFKDAQPFHFYNQLNIHSAEGENLEQFFINFLHSNTKERFNIVLTHFLQPVSSFFKAVKKELPQTKIINVDHNPRPLEGFPIKKRVKNRIKGLLYGRYIHKLVGVSNYTENYILKDFGGYLKNITSTIYNGIDISSCLKQELDRTIKPFKFIVVSHLRASKGIQDLLRAIAELDSTIRENLTIDIYGEGPFEDNLKQLCKTLQLDS